MFCKRNKGCHSIGSTQDRNSRQNGSSDPPRTCRKFLNNNNHPHYYFKFTVDSGFCYDHWYCLLCCTNSNERNNAVSSGHQSDGYLHCKSLSVASYPVEGGKHCKRCFCEENVWDMWGLGAESSIFLTSFTLSSLSSSFASHSPLPDSQPTIC